MKRRRLRRFGVLAALALLIPAAGSATYAAYRATSQNNANVVGSGTVVLGDNDGGSAAVSFSTGYPGHTDTGCIKVTYTGSLASTVRLYGTTSGTGLDQYLDVKVTRGSYAPSDPGFDSCTNFQADATNYIGAGAGVVYNGTLQGYADTYAAGLVEPTSGSPESWATNESHVYKIQVTLQNNAAAAGKNASQTFTWEARNQ